MSDCIVSLILFDKNNMMVQCLVLDNLNSFLFVSVRELIPIVWLLDGVLNILFDHFNDLLFGEGKNGWRMHKLFFLVATDCLDIGQK